VRLDSAAAQTFTGVGGNPAIAADIDSSDVLGPRTITKTDTAESWLAGLLSDGDWHESKGLKALAEAEHVSLHEAALRAIRRSARERFGSDKPDTRFGMELVELTSVFAATEFNAFKAPCVKGIRVPGGADTTRKRLDELTDQAKRWGAKGLVWMRVEVGEAGGLVLNSPVAKFLSDEEQAAIITTLDAEVGDLLLLVADERSAACHVLGLVRLELGRPPVNEGGFNFLWVVDFPLFEGFTDDGRPISAHHPFTMPHVEDWHLHDSTDPAALLEIRSQAYDLTLNGWELGSGSVRIHRPDIQSRIFELLGISAEEAQAKFGFLLDAFRFGAPPHAGFAFGIDRLVALLAGEENIREVIAFPKTQSGSDPLTSAPTPIDPAQLTELGLRLLPKSS